MSKTERLCDVLSNEVTLSKRIRHDGKDLGSLREHLEAANPSDPRLVSQQLSTDDQYYMWVFNQLCRSRTFEQGIPSSIPLDVYNDYMTLFDDTLDLEELLLLQALDDTFVRTMIKNREA